MGGQEGQSMDLGHGSGRAGIPDGTATNWGHRGCAAPQPTVTGWSCPSSLLEGLQGRAVGRARCGEVLAVNVVSNSSNEGNRVVNNLDD